jgi:hypothetical protein
MPKLVKKEPLLEDSRRRMRLEARRRWRLTHRSTGPRSQRGKRRSSLNRLRRGLCPVWVAEDLRARGEDPRQFSALHRDLIGWLGPADARTRFLVEMLAEAWCEKMRRIRNWVGAGAPDTVEADKRIDELLQRFVWSLGLLHRKWRYRLESALNERLPGPAALRLSLEARIPALGGKPPRRLGPSTRGVERTAAGSGTAVLGPRASGGSGQSAGRGGVRHADRALAEILALLAELDKTRPKPAEEHDASPRKIGG